MSETFLHVWSRMALLMLVAFLAVGSPALMRVVRRRRMQGLRLDSALLPRWRPGAPSVLYFSSEGCVECGQRQAAVMDRLIREGVSVHKVDAPRSPELTRSFSILTVPTTIVLDGNGILVNQFQGVVSEARLREELDGMEV